MTKIKNISENKNYTAVNIGSLDALMEYSLVHPKSGQELKGKVFLKDAIKSTGTEISFQMLPPKAELPFLHSHIQNEETYIFLKGSGDFQVDNNYFAVSEGSIVRVAPQGVRGLRNSSDVPMVYMVIQSKENSLEQHTGKDGKMPDYQPKWE